MSCQLSIRFLIKQSTKQVDVSFTSEHSYRIHFPWEFVIREIICDISMQTSLVTKNYFYLFSIVQHGHIETAHIMNSRFELFIVHELNCHMLIDFKLLFFFWKVKSNGLYHNHNHNHNTNHQSHCVSRHLFTFVILQSFTTKKRILRKFRKKMLNVPFQQSNCVIWSRVNRRVLSSLHNSLTHKTSIRSRIQRPSIQCV